jgi:hypothetical protein
MRSTRDPILEKQARIIFIFTVITFTLGFLTDITLPLLNIRVIPNVANVYASIWKLGAVFSTKDRGNQKGMGLGLTLCCWIIKRHDGHIRVESQQGKGTTVIIYLPAFSGND